MREDLLVVRPNKVIAALQEVGFELRRQTGSHIIIIMYKLGICQLISISRHPKDLPKGTLAAIIREAGLTKGEFLKLLWVTTRSLCASCIMSSISFLIGL